MVCPKHAGVANERRLDASIHSSRAELRADTSSLDAFDRLVATAHARSTLLARRRPHGGPDVVRGLVALARHARDWLRPAEMWLPLGTSPWIQFASLAEHLLASYPVPRFMNSVWFEITQDANFRQSWYKRLGRGENIRRIGLPISLTRAMAHQFASAPHHLTAIGALRWAQVTALGGTAELAKALIATRLGRDLGGEDFWETVIHFFVNHLELDLVYVRPIVDFLFAERFDSHEAVGPLGELEQRPPPRPSFEMKGRTAISMRRLVDVWSQARGRAPSKRVWPRSNVANFSWTEHTLVGVGAVRSVARIWSIDELCSAEELHVEGRRMRSCVATYSNRCLYGRTSIWSMKVETSLGVRHVLTLEVNETERSICQGRSKFNRCPNATERTVVRRWAEREGLQITDELLTRSECAPVI